jgi:hypothetical protein
MRTRYYPFPAIILSLVIFSSCKKDQPFCNCSADDLVSTVAVFSTGLDAPRGLKFGPDGNLYVAEGGIGGTDSTTCTQVIPPVGPYRGSDTGSRISRINRYGVRSTWVDNLPSSQTAPTQGGLVSGVGDLAFVGNTLYAIFAGAGCSHGVTGIPNGVIRVNPNRSWTMVANLSAYQMSHPVKDPLVGDFEPDGTWFSMVSVNGNLYAVEPNHGEMDKITPQGGISRIIDISAHEGHIVPTASTYYNGNFYVGNLGVFPATGISSVFKITPGGAISVVATGFSMVLGIVFDKAGNMYVLENTTGSPFPTPNTGDIVRIDPSGSRTVLTSGLNLPTALTFGPDEKLYVSNAGFGAPPGAGEILQITIACKRNKPVMSK